MDPVAQEPYKLGVLIDGSLVPHVFERAYAREILDNGTPRLKITTDIGYIDLMLALAEILPEPFSLLYVLVVPRDGQEAGRYRGPILDRAEVEQFLERFREPLERDARHHLWLAAIDEEGLPRGMLVYDLHNVLFAYGPLDQLARRLEELALRHTEAIELPFPHTHHYSERYDTDVEALLALYSWERSPLTDQDQ